MDPSSQRIRIRAGRFGLPAARHLLRVPAVLSTALWLLSAQATPAQLSAPATPAQRPVEPAGAVETAERVEAAQPVVEWQVSERGGGTPGGELVVALTAEPRTYSPLFAFDAATQAVVQRLHASLVRRDAETFELQPALATSWSQSPDGREVRLELRRGVRFSDGEPFDADDVVFTIRVAQDPEVGAAQADSFVLDGEPVVATKLGSHAVRLELPFTHPSPLRLLNDFPILPEHRLAAAYREGRLAEAWPLGTEPSEMAGLGPFRLARHEPGERLVLERNPHYWRRDERAPAGHPLPYLDRLVFELVADETAKVLRFRSGDSHLLERIPGDRFDALEQRSRQGAPFVVRDLGAGLGYTFVIFNLNEVELPEVKTRQRWFRRGEFRRAVSSAIDRRAIARLVYHGHATPLVSDLTPGNRIYWDEELGAAARGLEGPDLEAARQHLLRAGFVRDDEGFWLDAEGERIELTLVTNTSNTKRAATATLLQEDLRRLGLDVTFVGLEFGALVERLTRTFDYDLLLLEFGHRDLDPSSSLNVWRVGGSSHFFRLGTEEAGFAWEAEVDRLIRQQARETDFRQRRRLYLEAQQILAHEVPFVFLVAPNVLVGAHRRVGNFAPSILEHPTLWNADELYWTPVAGPGPAHGAR